MKRETRLKIATRVTEIIIILLLFVPMYFVCNFLQDHTPLVFMILFGIRYIIS